MSEPLEPWSLEVTPTFVVSTALATRDWTEVHHDRDAARSRGSEDIFVNILTSQALVQRYVTDRLGHDVEIAAIGVRLGAPAYPGDTLLFEGSRDGDAVSVTATAPRGTHITATVRLVP
jgi:hypothetical protein